jgi:hypothetical protein
LLLWISFNEAETVYLSKSNQTIGSSLKFSVAPTAHFRSPKLTWADAPLNPYETSDMIVDNNGAIQERRGGSTYCPFNYYKGLTSTTFPAIKVGTVPLVLHDQDNAIR